MRKIRYVIPGFMLYDRTGIQDYLEAQAEKGWMIQSVGANLWKFRRMEPKKRRFSVVYLPAVDLYDPEPSEREQTLREFCEHSGWHFAAAQVQMQVFWSDDPQALPIDTEPGVEVENIHRAVKKSMLPGCWVLTVLALLQVIAFWTAIFNGAVSLMAHNYFLYLAAWAPFVLAAYGLRLVRYYRWYRLARQAAARGEFLENARLSRKLERSWLIVFLTGLLAVLVLDGDTRAWATVFYVLLYAAVIGGCNGLLRRFLKKRGHDGASCKRILTRVTVVLLLAAYGGTSLLAGILEDRKAVEGYDLPMELSEFVQTDHETLVLEGSGSVLLDYFRVHQPRRDAESNGPELYYRLIRVKAGILYDTCLKAQMEDLAYLRYEMTEADPAPWQAERVWVLSGGERDGYLLCYEDHIISLWPGWDMTADQKALVGSKFR